VGGGRETRKYWRNFTNGTDLLVYMVDGSNSQSLEESKEELMRVLNSPDISDVPCLLISNKQVGVFTFVSECVCISYRLAKFLFKRTYVTVLWDNSH